MLIARIVNQFRFVERWFCKATVATIQARREGPGKPLLRGPVITSFCIRRDRDAEGVEREETWGEVSPHHPTRVRRNVVSSLSGVRGRAPAEKGFYAYLKSERSHLEYALQYFWAMSGPQTSRDPGKLPHFLYSTGLEPSEICANRHKHLETAHVFCITPDSSNATVQLTSAFRSCWPNMFLVMGPRDPSSSLLHWAWYTFHVADSGSCWDVKGDYSCSWETDLRATERHVTCRRPMSVCLSVCRTQDSMRSVWVYSCSGEELAASTQQLSMMSMISLTELVSRSPRQVSTCSFTDIHALCHVMVSVSWVCQHWCFWNSLKCKTKNSLTAHALWWLPSCVTIQWKTLELSILGTNGSLSPRIVRKL